MPSEQLEKHILLYTNSQISIFYLFCCNTSTRLYDFLITIVYCYPNLFQLPVYIFRFLTFSHGFPCLTIP